MLSEELGLSVYCRGFVGNESIYTCAAAEASSVYGRGFFREEQRNLTARAGRDRSIGDRGPSTEARSDTRASLWASEVLMAVARTMGVVSILSLLRTQRMRSRTDGAVHCELNFASVYGICWGDRKRKPTIKFNCGTNKCALWKSTTKT